MCEKGRIREGMLERGVKHCRSEWREGRKRGSVGDGRGREGERGGKEGVNECVGGREIV